MNELIDKNVCSRLYLTCPLWTARRALGKFGPAVRLSVSSLRLSTGMSIAFAWRRAKDRGGSEAERPYSGIDSLGRFAGFGKPTSPTDAGDDDPASKAVCWGTTTEGKQIHSARLQMHVNNRHAEPLLLRPGHVDVEHVR